MRKSGDLQPKELSHRLRSTGPDQKSNGVVLKKQFKKSQLSESGAYKGLMREGEFLVPGVVTGAEVKQVNATR